ncbi:hypothetical protein V6N11_010874 [Hibiscus sabdariffa]|uniref:Uncharacterized protein n=1 Tax=Hibiscus sabdariffa TaxID=183260 RepID=A0ABR2S6K0_9ROSI
MWSPGRRPGPGPVVELIRQACEASQGSQVWSIDLAVVSLFMSFVWEHVYVSAFPLHEGSALKLISALTLLANLVSYKRTWSMRIVEELGRMVVGGSQAVYTAASSSSDSVIKLGFLANKSDAFRPLGFKASDVIQLARHYGWCYWSSPRLVSVVTTSGTGYVLGSGNIVDLVGLCCTCAGTMMVATSVNSLNQVAFKSLITFIERIVKQL